MLPSPASNERRLTRPLPRWVAVSVIVLLVALMLGFFAQIRDSQYGWTKLIAFGSAFAPNALPELQNTPHYVDPEPSSQYGYDGQFYAQLALDPTLRNAAFPKALDSPAYRARRIGLPALSYIFGAGRPAWVIQIYPVLNIVFWVALAVILFLLHRPWTTQSLLCLGASLFGFGAIESISGALTDLPAATLIFASVVAAGSVAGPVLMGAALLVRETSLLAALASLEFRRPTFDVVRRNAIRLLVSVLPFALWFLYVRLRFGGQPSTGARNFSMPFAMIWWRLKHAWRDAGNVVVMVSELPTLFYRHFIFHELLVIVALIAQGLYLALRPAPRSLVWRIGAVYLVLGCILGRAVWEGTGAASRALLPMSIACNILLASEQRPRWFWSFFLVTAPAVPYGIFQLIGLHP